MLESAIESWVVNEAWTKLTVPAIKLNVRGDTGWPDRLFILPGGATLWIEFKRPGEPLEPKQDLKKQILEFRGHDHQVHTCRETAFRAIAEAKFEAEFARDN